MTMSATGTTLVARLSAHPTWPFAGSCAERDAPLALSAPLPPSRPLRRSGGMQSPTGAAASHHPMAGFDERCRGAGPFSVEAARTGRSNDDVLLVLALRDLVDQHRPNLQDRLDVLLWRATPVAALRAEELMAAGAAMKDKRIASRLSSLMDADDLEQSVAEIPARELAAVLIRAEFEAGGSVHARSLLRLARVIRALRRVQHQRRCAATAAQSRCHEDATHAS